MIEQRFLRVAFGVTEFARVIVDRSGTPGVSLALETTADGAVDETIEPDWVLAASRGAQSGLKWAVHSGDAAADAGVVLRAVIGTITDTTPAAVECAADAAVRRHFSGREFHFSVRPPWRVL